MDRPPVFLRRSALCNGRLVTARWRAVLSAGEEGGQSRVAAAPGLSSSLAVIQPVTQGQWTPSVASYLVAVNDRTGTDTNTVRECAARTALSEATVCVCVCVCSISAK